VIASLFDETIQARSRSRQDRLLDVLGIQHAPKLLNIEGAQFRQTLTSADA